MLLAGVSASSVPASDVDEYALRSWRTVSLSSKAKCTRETHFQALQHIVGIDLDTTHVELHGANVLADRLFLAKVEVPGGAGDGVVVPLGGLCLEGLKDLELALEKLLRVVALDRDPLLAMHGVLDDCEAAAVGVTAPCLILPDCAMLSLLVQILFLFLIVLKVSLV